MYRQYGQVVAVTNRSLAKRPFPEQIKTVCEIHPDALILREKDLTEEEYEKLAQEVMTICEAYQVPCILHTFWRAAEKLGCDTVHLPLPVFRQYAQKRKIQRIGTSVHSIEQALEAQSLGADYLTAGHIYVTDCKKGLEPRGLDFLRQVCSAVTIPVYAIGGIHFDETQWRELQSCGAVGGCIMSGMMTLPVR